MKTKYKIIKRFLDVFLATTLFIFLLPLMVVISVLVFINLGLPLFFSQSRPGLYGKKFVLLKFRTMSVDAEGAKSELDHLRLSKFGLLLRASSLDELPSLWNVIKGEMSFVGPRPLLMKYLDEYTPEQAKRHLVKPGITGLAQASGRNALSWEERFELDVYYVNNCSFLLDVSILLKTVKQVFKRSGISSPGHATMYEFKSGRDNG